MKKNTEFIYKIMNRKTGQFGDGRHYSWYDSFLDTTMYHKKGPAQASLTRLKKLAERWDKKAGHSKYAQELRDFVNDAEIVRMRIEIFEDIYDEQF